MSCVSDNACREHPHDPSAYVRLPIAGPIEHIARVYGLPVTVPIGGRGPALWDRGRDYAGPRPLEHGHARRLVHLPYAVRQRLQLRVLHHPGPHQVRVRSVPI